eukprot:4635346-Pleurochrysis_carterae.AAC.2
MFVGASFIPRAEMSFKRACGDAQKEICLVVAVFNALKMLDVHVSLAALRARAVPDGSRKIVPTGT